MGLRVYYRVYIGLRVCRAVIALRVYRVQGFWIYEVLGFRMLAFLTFRGFLVLGLFMFFFFFGGGGGSRGSFWKGF